MDSLPVPPALCALFDDHVTVGRNTAQPVNGTAGPSYRNSAHARDGAETEVKAQITLREVTAAAADFVDLPQATDLHLYAGADAVTIRFRSHELDTDPV